MNNKPAVILLVEDDEGHAIIAMRCFKEVEVANKVYWVTDGEEALDYLFHTGKYTDKEKARNLIWFCSTCGFPNSMDMKY